MRFGDVSLRYSILTSFKATIVASVTVKAEIVLHMAIHTMGNVGQMKADSYAEAHGEHAVPRVACKCLRSNAMCIHYIYMFSPFACLVP